MKQPFFSIIIPVYNVAKEYFDPCIQSLTEQSFGDFEIILVDDGSREECASLCDAYAREDARIRVIHQQNQGVSAARNHGIAEATGEWIFFVDSDDWVELDACERLRGYLEKNACEMLMFNLIKDFEDKQQKLNYGFESGHLYDASNVEVREFLYRKVMQPPNTLMGKSCTLYYSVDKVFRRSFLVDNHLQYPVGLPQSEDKVFILTCFEKLGRLYYVNDILYHYRINSASVSNRYSERVDVNRKMLASMLTEIAERMDREMAELTGRADYALIRKDCRRFLFGILTDVIRLKYYHPDAPYSRRERAKLAREFVNTEPFRSAVRKCRYRELSNAAKLKKLLLRMGWISMFYKINQMLLSSRGRVSGS